LCLDCQSLAQAAGAGNRTWRAYLSTQAPGIGDPDFVNARDRIGTGPWHNAKGAVIANSVEEFHSEKNNVTKAIVEFLASVPRVQSGGIAQYRR
jgi:hypothetical protein